MKKQLLFISLFVTLLVFGISFNNQANAQTSNPPFKGYIYLQPNVGIHQYFGDLNIDDLYNEEITLGYGAALGWQFSRIFGIRGNFNLGDIKGSRNDLGTHSKDFKSKLMYGSGQLTLNVNEIFNYNPKRFLTLYLMGGAGYLSSKATAYNVGTETEIPGSVDVKNSALTVPVGGGLGFRLSNVVGLNLEYNHHLMFKDDVLDNQINLNSEDYKDHLGYASLGLRINFKANDQDGDGVKDKNDLCPNEAGLPELMGCPDKDGDGIADKDDECPNEAGKLEFKGCPDTDGDGIPDKNDNCPNEAGTAVNNGCPDSDNDGVIDSEDNCPNIFGLKEFKGCPDTDGDGIADKDDACPDLRGPKATNGCPDTDGDGIADKDDECPTVAGVAANNGCPEEAQKPSVEIYKVVYFNTAGSVVLSKYTKDLDEVAKIMKENADVKVSVAGHADARGTDEFNMRLSEKRADYVINYLNKKGIDKARLIKSFYGESQPAAPNDGPENWSKNRRVEIKSVL